MLRIVYISVIQICMTTQQCEQKQRLVAQRIECFFFFKENRLKILFHVVIMNRKVSEMVKKKYKKKLTTVFVTH